MTEWRFTDPREIIPSQAETRGSSIAVVDGGQSFSYQDLNQLVSVASEILAGCQVNPGSHIGLNLGNSVDFIVWMFAAIQSRCVVATIDPATQSEALQLLLQVGEVDFLVTQSGAGKLDLDKWKTLAEHTVQVESAVMGRRGSYAGTVELDSEIILHRFSSGSTGEPKHILYSAGNIAEDYGHLSEVVSFSTDDVFLGVTPFFHSFGALSMFSALSAGGTLVIVKRFIPAQIIRDIVRYQPTVFFATPPMLEFLSKCHVEDAHKSAIFSLRHCICATGKLSGSIRERFRERFKVDTAVLFGSTETQSATITRDSNFEEGCVGLPMPGVSIQIFNESMQPVEVGTQGRVGVRSPACAVGMYYSDTNLNQHDGFILTGDIGFLDDAGNLHLKGRDDVVNIGGYKVDRNEVENLIQDKFPVSFVFVTEYQRAGQASLRAIVETNEEISPDTIISFCRTKLVDYKVPSKVDIVRSLPRDSNGKVRMSDLMDNTDL